MNRLINPPVKLYWAGWETDTIHLMRQGWEISTQQDVMRCTIRIAIKHPTLQLYGISNGVSEFNYENPEFFRDFVGHLQLARNIQVAGDFPASWDSVGEPAYTTLEIKDIEDLKIFKPIGSEIILPEKTVKQLLAEIMVKQSPKQKEIRERYLKERRYEKMKTEARIISLAS